MPNETLSQQLRFLLAADRLKGVTRKNYIIEPRRRENAAEHSWHLGLMAIILAEHANAPLDLLRVLKMLLIHDLVEVTAGDTYVYDAVANQTQAERERHAAEQVFGMLPSSQAAEFRALWQEFDARATPEARFADALDRLLPMLLNVAQRGYGWQEHGVKASQARARSQAIRDGSELLWAYAQSLLDEAASHGYFREG